MPFSTCNLRRTSIVFFLVLLSSFLSPSLSLDPDLTCYPAGGCEPCPNDGSCVGYTSRQPLSCLPSSAPSSGLDVGSAAVITYVACSSTSSSWSGVGGLVGFQCVCLAVGIGATLLARRENLANLSTFDRRRREGFTPVKAGAASSRGGGAGVGGGGANARSSDDDGLEMTSVDVGDNNVDDEEGETISFLGRGEQSRSLPSTPDRGKKRGGNSGLGMEIEVI